MTLLLLNTEFYNTLSQNISYLILNIIKHIQYGPCSDEYYYTSL